MRYSVAIRTLGLKPDVLRQELESVFAQTVKPEKVVIYIAEGYAAPTFRVGDELYVYTKKGMVAQRAVQYDEIETPLILLLDDDVLLAHDSVERLIEGLVSDNLDCIVADTYVNHNLPVLAKIYAALTNLTFPHFSGKYAFKIHSNGSFSYLNKPQKDIYLSQSGSGPCSLWQKQSLLSCRIADEVWLDSLGFPYNEDGLEFYKFFINGGKIGVHFNASVTNVNAQTSSGEFHRNPKKLYLRSRAQYLVWHRGIYSWRKSKLTKFLVSLAFMAKILWQLPVHVVAILQYRNIKAPYYLLKGTLDGIKYSHSDPFKGLPPYCYTPVS